MTDNERLAVLEQRVKHIEEHTAKTATKVDEIYAVLMQARGVRGPSCHSQALWAFWPEWRIGCS